MILKFFNKEEQLNKDDDLINVACLMIHAARIDENYTEKERKIIKRTLIKLKSDDEDIDKLILRIFFNNNLHKVVLPAPDGEDIIIILFF